MNYKFKNRRWPLLWRTVFLLTIFVIISQIIIYVWVQRSVSSHFEQMDAEIITHAAFNLRKQLTDTDEQTALSNLPSSPVPEDIDHLHSSWLDYDLKTLISNENGEILLSEPDRFAAELPADFNLLMLWQAHHEQYFTFKINNRNYRAIVIRNNKTLALIALPIDVHHQYLLQFNRQLSMILIAITLLLVSVAALSVYWGFAPLATIVQKMKGINPEQLDERVVVSNMPRELRPLAESYNLMMAKLESNFESLSRFSDNIAHELRTPLATLGTQTQVMLSKPRNSNEYIEQLHHQHDTLEQLSVLINNMLLLAKTQKGLSNSQLSRVDTETLITKLISYYELIAEDRGIFFEKKGNFQAVLGDDSLLQRLFANLISNAIYYAVSDSIITIEASLIKASTLTHTATRNLKGSKPSALQPSFLKIVLTNTLDEPWTQIEADKLFERFYRDHRTTKMHSGSGLGLSIAQAITQAHNGKVSISIKNERCFQVIVELSTAG
ncbi:two-component system heavy metal sensor histidine kinase CusS [Psychrobacter sp. PL15]|uniref:ATP-binding protein n=1 Tax=Psychrobacter sp. PL15 TaxID=3071719 RepID=UPI002DFB8458|nr:two-component system heavy metal sensor histidine kinase CusS [Psychrobacter sp. PL15]